jgi:hypothetical protein
VRDGILGTGLNTCTTLDARSDIERQRFTGHQFIHTGRTSTGTVAMADALVIIYFNRYFTTVPFFDVHSISGLVREQEYAAGCGIATGNRGLWGLTIGGQIGGTGYLIPEFNPI